MGAAAAALLLGQLLPAMGPFSQAGIRTLGMLVAFLIMLITEALPVVVTSLLFSALMPVLGVTENLAGGLAGYSQPIVFFTLASFGIAAAISAVPLSRRILRGLLRAFGKNTERAILAMMVCEALVSSVVSNVPTCAIFMAIALSFARLYTDEAERRRTLRALMIAVPVASMIGGMMTPAGSSVNLMAISLLEDLTGQTIPFVLWMCAGIPLAAVMIPLAWFLIVKIYRPVPVDEARIRGFAEELGVPDRMDAKERKVVWLMAGMMILWVASSWIPSINVMVVAILGCCVLFLPGVEILDIRTFLKENSWDAFFLVGTVLSISGALIDNGVSAAISGLLPAMEVSTPVLLAATAVLVFAALLINPVATSMLPILAAPLVSIAQTAGVPAALVLMTAALCAGNCYLLPLDTVTLITYGKGYYSMTDMARSTVFLQMAMVLLCALWLPVVGRFFGMG